MPPPSLTLRPGTAADLPAIRDIYAWHVTQGSGSFELEAPSVDEMARRHAEVRSRGLPWLVAETPALLCGYAYANHFRPRPAYRHSLEDSVYLHPDAAGQGIGRLLLAELMARCAALGARQMVAVIGDSSNHSSIALHRALGFEQTGLLRSVGWKFGRWLDIVMMQRALGSGDRTGGST
jgi:phosphinothricin acetyltransferase